MIGLLLRLLLLPLRLALLPLKILRGITTFITCVVPLIVVVAIGAVAVWFLFIR